MTYLTKGWIRREVVRVEIFLAQIILFGYITDLLTRLGGHRDLLIVRYSDF